MAVHDSLIDLLVKLNYTNDNKGCCHGISWRWLEASLLGEEKRFDERIRRILATKKNIIHSLNTLKTKKGRNLTQEDNNLLDITAFLNSLILYQYPTNHYPLFNDNLNQQNIEAIANFAASDAIQSRGGLVILHSEPMIYNIAEIAKYLNDLARILEKNSQLPNQVFGIELMNQNHTMALSYIRGKGWRLMDINQYPTKFFNLKDTARLAHKIASGFKEKPNSPYTAFNVRVITTGNYPKLPQLKNALSLFKKQHHLTKAMAQRTEAVNLLYIAAKYGHLETIEELIKYKTNLNVSDVYGLTPIHLAADYGYEHIVDLLAQYIDVNLTDYHYWSAVDFAVDKGHAKVIAVLAKHGADFQSRDIKRCTLLHTAAAQNHLEVISELIKNGVDPNAVDLFGETAVHYAAINNHPETIIEFAKYKVNLDTPNDTYLTPMFYAAQKGYPKVIAALIACGVSPRTTSRFKQTLAHCAAQYGHQQVIADIASKGVNLNARDALNWTAAHHAARNNHPQVIRELAKHNADLNATDALGLTPAYYALINNHAESLAALVKNGVKLNKIGKYNWTFAHHAVINNRPNMLKELTKYGVDLEAPDISGWTPAFYTAQYNYPDCIPELIKQGVSLDKKDNFGWTPAHYAAQNGFHEVLAKLAKYGVALNTPNTQSLSPLYYAVQKGAIDAVIELIKANVNCFKPAIISINDCKALFINHNQTITARMNYFIHINQDRQQQKIAITPRNIAYIMGQESIIPILNKTKKIQVLYQSMNLFQNYGKQLSPVTNPQERKKALLLVNKLKQQTDYFIYALFKTHDKNVMNTAQKTFQSTLNQCFMEMRVHKTAWRPFLTPINSAAKDIDLLPLAPPPPRTEAGFFRPKTQPRELARNQKNLGLTTQLVL